MNFLVGLVVLHQGQPVLVVWVAALAFRGGRTHLLSLFQLFLYLLRYFVRLSLLHLLLGSAIAFLGQFAQTALAAVEFGLAARLVRAQTLRGFGGHLQYLNTFD